MQLFWTCFRSGVFFKGTIIVNLNTLEHETLQKGDPDFVHLIVLFQIMTILFQFLREYLKYLLSFEGPVICCTLTLRPHSKPQYIFLPFIHNWHCEGLKIVSANMSKLLFLIEDHLMRISMQRISCRGLYQPSPPSGWRRPQPAPLFPVA